MLYLHQFSLERLMVLLLKNIFSVWILSRRFRLSDEERASFKLSLQWIEQQLDVLFLKLLNIGIVDLLKLIIELHTAPLDLGYFLLPVQLLHFEFFFTFYLK